MGICVVIIDESVEGNYLGRKLIAHEVVTVRPFGSWKNLYFLCSALPPLTVPLGSQTLSLPAQSPLLRVSSVDCATRITNPIAAE